MILTDLLIALLAGCITTETRVWMLFDYAAAIVTFYFLWRLAKPKAKELVEDRQPPE